MLLRMDSRRRIGLKRAASRLGRGDGHRRSRRDCRNSIEAATDRRPVRTAGVRRKQQRVGSVWLVDAPLPAVTSEAAATSEASHLHART